jgi:two-component system, NarL family, sensor histidine kinase LiaS
MSGVPNEPHRPDALLEERVRQRTGQLQSQLGKLQALTCQWVEAGTRQRAQLAWKLHDNVQQLVSAAKIRLGMLRRRSVDAKIIQTLLEVERLLNDALRASQSLTAELGPAFLAGAGLVKALERLAQGMEKDHGLSVTLRLKDFSEPASEQTCSVVFDCVQELLFCVIVKHAQPKSAEVIASTGADGQLTISVVDRGNGLDLGGDEEAGLGHLRQRLASIGATAKSISAKGRGSRVEMRVPPLAAADQAAAG